jgi:hypothetical protein
MPIASMTPVSAPDPRMATRLARSISAMLDMSECSLVCYIKSFSSLFVAVPEEKNQICKKSPETGKINSVELVNRARGGQKEATQCS